MTIPSSYGSFSPHDWARASQERDVMAQAPPSAHALAVDQLIWSSTWHAIFEARAPLGGALLVLLALTVVARLIRNRKLGLRRRASSLGSHKTARMHLRVRLRTHYASRKLTRISPRDQPALAFQYLKSVCPFTFEEMILLQLEARKIKVRRNSRYTGDGGIDGAFWVGQQLWLVQAKKYTGMVKAGDLLDFSALCESMDAFGLFVHTGRTPPAAHTIARESVTIDVLSGDRLISLFAGDGLRLRPGKERPLHEMTPNVAAQARALARPTA